MVLNLPDGEIGRGFEPMIRKEDATTDGPDGMQIRMPKYVQRFSCIGPRCEDSCCVGWIVPVEPATFNHYQTLEDPELGPLLRRSVLKDAGDSSWAHIEMNADDHRCPILTTEGLCRVHQKLGEGHLSVTCSSYPRVQSMFGGEVIRGASLSCPEAARLALLDPGAMELAWVNDPQPDRIHTKNLPDPDPSFGDPLSFGRQIRTECLRMLQQRAFSIEARVIALGFAIRRLTDAQDVNAPLVGEVFDHYHSQLGVVQAEIDAMAPQRMVQLQILKLLVEDQVEFVSRSPRYIATIERLSHGFNVESSPLAEGFLAKYTSAFDKIISPYLALKPHILENFLVNQIYSTVFPFTPGRTCFEEYVLLVIRYAILKLLLVGIGSAEGKMNDELLIEAIQPFQKAVEHNIKYLPHVLELLRKNQVINMPYMTILVIN